MKTYLRVSNQQAEALPEAFAQEADVRGSRELVRAFLSEYTRPGDLVFDPFAGFGATLLAAQEMGRRTSGIEYLAARCNYIRARLQAPESLLQGDARQLATYPLPPIDFTMGSPPYMYRDDPEDPFSAYESAGRGYAAYLDDIRSIYRQLGGLMTDAATAVIEVSNLKRGGSVTPLAWDVAQVASEVLHFRGEVVVEWEPTHGFGSDHSYCLIFTK